MTIGYFQINKLNLNTTSNAFSLIINTFLLVYVRTCNSSVLLDLKNTIVKLTIKLNQLKQFVYHDTIVSGSNMTQQCNGPP